MILILKINFLIISAGGHETTFALPYVRKGPSLNLSLIPVKFMSVANKIAEINCRLQHLTKSSRLSTTFTAQTQYFWWLLQITHRSGAHAGRH